MEGDYWVVNSKERLANAHAALDEAWGKKHWFQMQIITDQARTKKQNSSLQEYCHRVAVALNDSGQEQHIETPAGSADVPWNKNSVRETFWRKLQIVMTGHESTTKPSRQEYQEVYEVMNRFLIDKKGIHVGWPSK